MTRKKVKLAYITNESARKATFKKRKKGVMKKVSELSTLCDVRACAIIYSPYDAQPEVWPGSPGTAQLVLSEFKKMPEMEQSKKMVNQESFLKQRLAKVEEQLKKQHKDNREKEITCLMYRTLTLTSNSNNKGGGNGNFLLQGLSMVDLNDLGWIIDQNLKDIHARMDDLREKEKEKRREEEGEEEKKVVAGMGDGGVLGAEVGASSSSSNSNNNGVTETEMLQNPWLMNLLGPNDHMGFCGVGGGEDMNMNMNSMNMMLQSFGEDPHSHNAFWSTFFP